MAKEPPRKTLREWRSARLLTQVELGELVGVTHYTISAWETGAKQPRFKNIRALAAALGVLPEQITLPGKGNPAAQ